jgi:hypothetical protein
MENYSVKKSDEENQLRKLRERKEDNLRIIQSRLHDLEIEKQRRERQNRENLS